MKPRQRIFNSVINVQSAMRDVLDCNYKLNTFDVDELYISLCDKTTNIYLDINMSQDNLVLNDNTENNKIDIVQHLDQVLFEKRPPTFFIHSRPKLDTILHYIFK